MLHDLTALSQAEVFRTITTQPSIVGYRSTTVDQFVVPNTQVLASLAKCVIFCGRQGLTLSGLWDDATANPSMNRGNFKSLVEFRAASRDVVL